MIELSDEQVLILQKGEQKVVNPRTKEEFVLVRRETYDRLRALLEDDFGPEDAFRAQIESAAAAGWDDPALDVYNDVENPTT
jgi:hypothetical protein